MSQYWIYFSPGSGGDGLANLLERCHGICPIDDHPIDRWRIHRIVDGQVKFFSAKIDSLGCFRLDMPFSESNNKLTDRYQSLISENQKIIVTSHDIELKHLEYSEKKDILCKNQIKIVLESRDYYQSYILQLKKNLIEFPVSILRYKIKTRLDGFNILPPIIDLSKFDHRIFIEDIWDSFSYFRDFIKILDLDIDKRHYDQYLRYVNGDTRDVADMFQDMRVLFIMAR